MTSAGRPVEAVRDAVFYSPGETISNFVAQACAAELRRRAQRNGAPYPKRTAPLRRGRPINRERERNAVEGADDACTNSKSDVLDER